MNHAHTVPNFDRVSGLRVLEVFGVRSNVPTCSQRLHSWLEDTLIVYRLQSR